MITSLLAMTAVPLNVLFLGNSHTQYNNVPELVRSIAASAGQDLRVEMRIGAFLEDVAGRNDVRSLVRSGKVHVLVMQAAKVSSSHRYVYSQAQGIALAKEARDAGIRVVLFSEWPRQGVDETAFIENVYRGIARESGAEIAPVGRVWDKVLRQAPKLQLWSDGNHATPKGSFLAAQVLYRWITKDGKSQPTFRTDAVTPGESRWFEQVARESFAATQVD